MLRVQTAEDIYPALDELVEELNTVGQSCLANTLHHRVHQVAWTARSELFEELRDVLTAALRSDDANLPGKIRYQMERVLAVIHDSLEAQS